MVITIIMQLWTLLWCPGVYRVAQLLEARTHINSIYLLQVFQAGLWAQTTGTLLLAPPPPKKKKKKNNSNLDTRKPVELQIIFLFISDKVSMPFHALS